MPGFPGCLEDEEFPFTGLKSALYQDPLLSSKWAEQPDTREYPADSAVSYHASGDVYSREHWDNHEGALCPSRVEYVQPVRLRNTEGRWRVIVNKIALYNQVRVSASVTSKMCSIRFRQCEWRLV